jgi:hypothetical protein
MVSFFHFSGLSGKLRSPAQHVGLVQMHVLLCYNEGVRTSSLVGEKCILHFFVDGFLSSLVIVYCHLYFGKISSPPA